MQNQKIILLKRRDAGAIINDTSEFAQKNFGKYSKGFLYYVMPPLLLVMVALTYLFNSFSHLMSPKGMLSSVTSPTDLIRLFSSFFVVGFGIFIIMIAVSVIQNLLAFEYVLLYDSKGDPREITMEELWGAMRSNTGIMLTSYIGLFLMMFVFMIAAGFIAFLLFKLSAGLGVLFIFVLFFILIYLYVPLSNFLIIRLRERLGIFEALARCYQLTRGKWWGTFGALFLVALIVSGMQYICILPLTAINMVTLFHSIASGHPDPGAIYTPLYGITQAVSVAVGLYLSGILQFAICINYYSLVERTDNVSLQREIEAIGQKKDTAHTQEGEF